MQPAVSSWTGSQAGDKDALRELIPVVYEELKAIASRQRSRGPAHETLDTTALVHEAFLKLTSGKTQEFNDRCHFFAVAATAMRHLIVDYARHKAAERRGGGQPEVSLDRLNVGRPDQTETVLAIDDALARLRQHSDRMVQVVECRFFGGMTEMETAIALGVTERTVRRDWTKARAWLYRDLATD